MPIVSKLVEKILFIFLYTSNFIRTLYFPLYIWYTLSALRLLFCFGQFVCVCVPLKASQIFSLAKYYAPCVAVSLWPFVAPYIQLGEAHVHNHQQVNLARQKQRQGKNQCCCHVTLQNWKISLIFTYDMYSCSNRNIFVSYCFMFDMWALVHWTFSVLYLSLSLAQCVFTLFGNKFFVRTKDLFSCRHLSISLFLFLHSVAHSFPANWLSHSWFFSGTIKVGSSKTNLRWTKTNERPISELCMRTSRVCASGFFFLSRFSFGRFHIVVDLCPNRECTRWWFTISQYRLLYWY